MNDGWSGRRRAKCTVVDLSTTGRETSPGEHNNILSSGIVICV